MHQVAENKRKRAPSQRSLETKSRIFDAAELLFAERGFEGASLRDIANRGNVRKALVSFYGGSKEGLFTKVIARRAQELADIRSASLAALLDEPDVSIKEILQAFIRPLLKRSIEQGPQWQAYARLIAHVSADPRWQPITQSYFDPTAKKFIKAIVDRQPSASHQAVASCFVFTIAAMLSLCTSNWRIVALGDVESPPNYDELLEDLTNFCEAGLRQVVTLHRSK